jgi:hypothetical protein
MNIKLIILSILILVAGFCEIIVFNEEVLLALCFVSFVFFAYSYLSQTVFAVFDDRAKKFEADILVAFNSKRDIIIGSAEDLFQSKIITTILFLFHQCIMSYNLFLFDVTRSSRILTTNADVSFKLNDIVTTERKLAQLIQKSNIQSVIYPFVFSRLVTR